MRFARRLLVALLCPVLLCALDYRAGVSRLEISPGRWARALAIEDTRNGRVVFAAADGTALSWQVAELVAARVLKEYDLDRARLVLNVSGGDSAPIGEEGMKLADALVTVSGAALGALRPARTSFARGGAENSGVAALSVTGLDGSARALLYDRACGKAAPAGAFELSEAHGTPPPAEVARVLESGAGRVHGSLRAVFQVAGTQPRLRETSDGAPAARVPHSVQAIRFGDALTVIVLGGRAPASCTAQLPEDFRRSKMPLFLVGCFPEGDGQERMADVLREVFKRIER
jgi:hypothetical protein